MYHTVYGAAVFAKLLDRLGDIITDSTKAKITAASVAIQLHPIKNFVHDLYESPRRAPKGSCIRPTT